MKRLINLLFSASLSVFLISCGGGGGDSVAGGGIGGTGISYGKASSFGSVTVNGTKFDTDDALIVINDDSSAVVDDLKVGQVVRIEDSDDDDGIDKASKVEYEAAVRGPVESFSITNIDNFAATLTVMGQVVKTNSLTVFGNFLLDPANDITGSVVEVSGLRDAENNIITSYIEIKSFVAGVDEYRVVGTVEAPVTQATFNIAGLEVDYSGTGAIPAAGDLVRVKGLGYTAPTLTATSIQAALSPSTAAGNSLKIEGYVTSYDGLNLTFNVNGLAVNASGAVIEEQFGTLGENARIEVQGVMNDTGTVLLASKVEVKPGNDISIQGTVSSLDSTSNTLTMLGGEVTVKIDEFTQLEDDREDNPISIFNLVNFYSVIQAGDYLEIRGYQEGNTVVATKLERDDPDNDNRAHLQAPVQSFNATTHDLVLLNVAIDSDPQVSEYKDVDEGDLQPGEFFNRLSLDPPSLVKARWRPFISTDEVVEELSLELEDD